MARFMHLAELVMSAGVGFVVSQAVGPVRDRAPETTAAAEAPGALTPPAPAAPLRAAAGVCDQLVLEEVRQLRTAVESLSHRLPGDPGTGLEGSAATRTWERLVLGSIAEFRDTELRRKLEFAIRAQISRIRSASVESSPADLDAIRGFERQLEAIGRAPDATAMLAAASAPPLEYTPQDPRFEEYEREHGDVFIK